MNRRALLTTSSLLTVGAIAACSTPSGKLTPAQIIADATGAVQGLENVIPALENTKPPVLTATQGTPIEDALKEAMAYLTSIGPGTPAQTGATTLAMVAGYLNSALSILTALPIPAPYNVIVMAAAVIAPEIEAWVASIMPPAPAPTPSPAPAAARAARVAHGMSIEKARAVLKVAQ